MGLSQTNLLYLGVQCTHWQMTSQGPEVGQQTLAKFIPMTFGAVALTVSVNQFLQTVWIPITIHTVHMCSKEVT